MTFMIGQLLIARVIIATVLRKAAIFHRGLNGRREWTIRSRLCLISASFFNFFKFFFKKQKMVAAEENEKEVVSVEEDGREAEDVSLCASVSVPPVSKSSKLRG